jgi:hypothetical protein
MANRIKNKNKNKRPARVNPTARRPQRIPRPLASFDGSTLHGTHFATRDLTVANQASHNLIIDCANNFGSVAVSKIFEGVGRDLTGITGKYQEYRYTSVTCKWLPHVAPGVADGGSSIVIGYIDNPELMLQRLASSAGNDIAAIKGTRNIATFNAWEGFTYYVPLSYRRKWFSVNTNTAYPDATAMDKDVQGMVVFGLESLSAAMDLGVMHTIYNVELRGLNTVLAT